MIRKVLIGSGVVAVLGAALVLANVTLSRVLAHGDMSGQTPAVTAEQARLAAQSAFPSATITAAALEDDDGVLVYSVRLTDPAGVRHDVKVDAQTDQLRGVEADDGEGDD